jgi:hypothetical protein
MHQPTRLVANYFGASLLQIQFQIAMFNFKCVLNSFWNARKPKNALQLFLFNNQL